MHTYKVIPDGQEILIRFEGKFEKRGKDDCWLWHSTRLNTGYGVLRYKMENYLAHRVAFSLYKKEPLVQGLAIDHLCDTKCCVNPRHLNQTTIVKNSTRGRISARGKSIYKGRNLYYGKVTISTMLLNGECNRGHTIKNASDIRLKQNKLREKTYYECRICINNRQRKG